MFINVYMYGQSAAGHLTLTTSGSRIDCILIGSNIMRSDRVLITQNQSARVLSIANVSARVYVEATTPIAGIYIIKRFTFLGNFNKDNLSATFSGDSTTRLEIRNKYGVLIWDNGKPLPDGTYPPDAKNREGLTGLHAAPAVINTELETALMGDETNKERVQE